MDSHTDLSSLRNFKDFLQLYSVMSESCFLRRVTAFNTREMTEEEAICVDRCAGKHVKVSKKVLDVYEEIQPQITKKRMDEMAALQESLEKQKQPSEETQQSEASSS
jgi:hypothetical protein